MSAVRPACGPAFAKKALIFQSGLSTRLKYKELLLCDLGLADFQLHQDKSEDGKWFHAIRGDAADPYIFGSIQEKIAWAGSTASARIPSFVPLWDKSHMSSPALPKFNLDASVLTGRKKSEGILKNHKTATELRAISGATLAAGKGENEARIRAREFHDG